jgi:hypothetical protein
MLIAMDEARLDLTRHARVTTARLRILTIGF